MARQRAMSNYSERITAMRLNGRGYGEIAKELGIKRASVMGWCQRQADAAVKGQRIDYEKRFAERVKANCPGFEYAYGYTGRNDPVHYRCEACGLVFEQSAAYVKVSNKRKVYCPACSPRRLPKPEKLKLYCARCGTELSGNHRKHCSEYCREQDLLEERAKANTKACAKCGKTFIAAHGGIIYCSNKCRQSVKNKRESVRKDKRLRKNGKPDYSITLEKLIARDNCTCYLCGQKCDVNDMEIIDGVYIAGDNYPSVDHVLPISKGGKHEWSNVKLAHRDCNMAKSDDLLFKQAV